MLLKSEFRLQKVDTDGHLACELLYFVSIIGIPFGYQHLKLTFLALAQIGKTMLAKKWGRMDVGNLMAREIA